MSGFCVFGLSFNKCIEKAEKMVPVSIKSNGKSFCIIQSKHSAYSILLADKLFKDDEVRLTKISPAFDAPQFAKEWMDIATKTNQARRMKIMVKGKKVDAKGADVIRKGAAVIVWIDYQP